jgi:hypothetical protein
MPLENQVAEHYTRGDLGAIFIEMTQNQVRNLSRRPHRAHRSDLSQEVSRGHGVRT